MPAGCHIGHRRRQAGFSLRAYPQGMAERGTDGRQGPWMVPAGRIAGVPFVISPWWFVAAVAFTLFYAPSLRTEAAISRPASYAVGLALVLLIYAGVLIHEASHVLVAKALGLPVGRVVLQLLGGVSEILEEPGTAAREYLVAAVGPLTSVLLVGVSAAFLPVFTPHSVPWVLAAGSALANASIAVFNLLPGLPLDGGRVAHAAIWQVTRNKGRATIVAAWIGRIIAVGIALAGFGAPATVLGTSGLSIGGFYFVLLAIFMWSNASVALAQAKVAEVLPSLDPRSLLRKAMPVEAQLPVAEAIRRARLAGARALVVVDGRGRPQGLVSESAVMAVPENRRPWVSVSEFSHPVSGSVLREGVTGEALMDAIRSHPAGEYLVVADTGAIRGVLTRADVTAALRAAGIR
jgi:Zn-dependent protease